MVESIHNRLPRTTNKRIMLSFVFTSYKILSGTAGGRLLDKTPQYRKIID
ncbi:hypothetical protein [Pseudogracilibacillus auburnensis]|nr:hypothetical protein [Pseudogracilibacillus auburnensis]MBO1002039.1 hypothetical protein [Pseudogracilibacillus auburnensis]